MKPNQVSKSEFKAKTMELVHHVEVSGQSLIVTDHGKPVLEVRIYSAASTPLDLLRNSLIRYDYPMEPVDQEYWSSTK